MKPLQSNAYRNLRGPSVPNWAAPLLYLIGTGSLLGISTNLAKFSSTVGLSPVTLLIWSTMGATAVLAVVTLVRKQLPKFTGRLVEYSVVSALLGVVGPNLILFSAVPRVGAGFVTLSLAFPPLFTYLAAIALGMERYRHLRAIGVALALAGAALLAVLRLSAPDADSFWIAATVSVPVVLAIGNIYRTRRWPQGAEPQELAPAMLIASSTMLVTLAYLIDLPLHITLNNNEPLLLIVAQSTVFSFQYLLFFKLQAQGGPVYLSLLGSVAAVVGIPIAVFLQNEAPLDGLSIGAVLIVAGIFLVARGGFVHKTRIAKNPDGKSIRITDEETPHIPRESRDSRARSLGLSPQ